MPVCSPGATAIRVSTTGEASLPAMTMATACAKCTSTRWKAFGLSCGVGCARIGVFPKRNSRSTWDSSSSCTTSASGAKRCFLRSLSSWSRKTLESNMSVVLMLDGLDEAQDARRLEVYVERLIRYNYDYFKIVLTSRSGYNADRLLRVRQFTQFELQGLTRAES